MKIKEVCQKTGLTDKAVRTYIKEELISPNYDENYMGRRTFNFSDEDVQQLRKIVILRKYNFSLKEIKALFAENVTAKELLASHIEEMKSDINVDIDIINSMINVSVEMPENVDELCKMLDTPQIAKKPIPIIDNTAPYRKINESLRKKNKIIIISAVLIVVTVLMIATCIIISYSLSTGVLKNKTSSLIFSGFCIIESDTAENTFNDIEKNYTLYTDSIIYLDDNLNIDNVSNHFVKTNASVLNENYNEEADRQIILEAEYQPTKEYYKIMPIVSTEEGESYTNLDYSSAWIKSNEDFEYKTESITYANGVFVLDIKIFEKE